MKNSFWVCRVTPQKASNPTYRDFFWIILDHGMLNKDYHHGLCTGWRPWRSFESALDAA
jgi:hypothetical protein